MKKATQQLQIEWGRTMLIIKNGNIYERPTWRDAATVARLYRKRIQMGEACKTLCDLMLHGY